MRDLKGIEFFTNIRIKTVERVLLRPPALAARLALCFFGRGLLPYPVFQCII